MHVIYCSSVEWYIHWNPGGSPLFVLDWDGPLDILLCIVFGESSCRLITNWSLRQWKDKGKTNCKINRHIRKRLCQSVSPIWNKNLWSDAKTKQINESVVMVLQSSVYTINGVYFWKWFDITNEIMTEIMTWARHALHCLYFCAYFCSSSRPPEKRKKKIAPVLPADIPKHRQRSEFMR